MSIEELLLPRVKVNEEGYPDMPYQRNQIITLANFDAASNQYYYLAPNQNKYYAAYYRLYPSIFKPLQWYEERKIEEMPEYVKCIKENIKEPYEFNGVYETSCFYNEAIFVCFIPATATEYESYIKNKMK